VTTKADGGILALSPPQALNAQHDVSGFSCGKPALDHWLKTRALSNQQKGFTVVMVIADGGRVVGYYGLAPTAIVPSVMPRSVRTGQPPNPVPCILLGQIATDAAFARRGIGTALLQHALIRSVAGAQLIGGRALVVSAIDEDAAHYWRRHGFLPSKDDPLILFRSLSDIAASLDAAGLSNIPPGAR
jgi:GNAT superfamily N-acetyltransferase